MTVGRDLASFRNAHADADIVVCGCGRSLNELASPSEYLTIGVNDVGRLFDPTYLVVVNPRSQFKADRFRYVEGSRAEALFTQLDLGRVQPPLVRFRLGKYGGTDAGDGHSLHYTQNSPYVAVCLAAYMGARRVGLIGVDLTDDHFFGRTGRHALAGRVREIDAQYGRLAQALKARGVELVNLSAISRLTSLPHARLDGDGGWRVAARLYPVEAAAHVAAPDSERCVMRVSVDRRSGSGLVAQLLDALAASAAKLAHSVSRDPRSTSGDPRTVSIVWNGRGHIARGPTLYCEHGWLPRSAYQISPSGINAASHLAPFTWSGTPLTVAEEAALDAHIASIKTASFEGYYRYMQAASAVSESVPSEFLLVPLQIEADTNIVHHAPPLLRTMQALVDHVSRLNPPWPVIFKQHPADSRRGDRHLRLRLRRGQDVLWAQSRGNIHQLLQSGGCRGIITINSNVAHDGLLWDVPAVVLGRNVWPSTGPHRPFLTEIPRDWSQMHESVTSADAVACRRAYAHFLMINQWTIADARDPGKVGALLASARPRRTGGRIVTPVNMAARPAPRLPVINVVASNRGWLFEAWKRAFAAASHPGFEIVAGNAPLPRAAAWIYIRAKEAASTPDPSRTVVQIHDLLDGDYGPGGARACVARCAGLSLTHPAQKALLESSGISLGGRHTLMQPVGWGLQSALPLPAGDKPSIAWIGRPATHGGMEVTRLAWFLEAAAALRGRARVSLVGERLNGAITTLRRTTLECRLEGIDKFPLLRASEWIGRFDCVVITGAADAGPWPLFDALNAGVPVVAAPAGWASRLLADGVCGVLADGPTAIVDAIDQVVSQREAWRARRTDMRARVADYSLARWIESNLTLAADLARDTLVRHEVA